MTISEAKDAVIKAAMKWKEQRKIYTSNAGVTCQKYGEAGDALEEALDLLATTIKKERADRQKVR